MRKNTILIFVWAFISALALTSCTTIAPMAESPASTSPVETRQEGPEMDKAEDLEQLPSSVDQGHKDPVPEKKEDLQESRSSAQEPEAEKGLPAIELHVLMGPEYAQEGLICFYRVKALVKDNDAALGFRFNRDDSNGAWGNQIAQINLMEGQSFTLVCEVEDTGGIASASMTFRWQEPIPSADPKAQGSETGIDFSDPDDFLIDVDLSVQRVDIYYQGEIIKSMLCSGGKPETPTPTGTYRTTQKIEYAYVERFGQAAYYWTRFHGPYLFHSVPYDKDGNLQTEELAKIGSPASHGCIRLYLEDAKWMYDRLPLGVMVQIAP